MESGRMRDLEDAEFVAAPEAGRDTRRGVGAQHPLMWTGLRTAGHVGIERPVFLYRAAGEPVEMPDVNRVRARGGAQKCFQSCARVGGVKVHCVKTLEKPCHEGRQGLEGNTKEGKSDIFREYVDACMIRWLPKSKLFARDYR